MILSLTGNLGNNCVGGSSQSEKRIARLPLTEENDREQGHVASHTGQDRWDETRGKRQLRYPQLDNTRV